MEVGIHFSEDKKKIKKLFIIVLVLLLGYGYYKNGLAYVFLGDISFGQSLEVLVFPFLGILINIISNLLHKKKIGTDLWEGLFLSLLVPVSLPWYLFLALLLGYFGLKNIRLKTVIAKSLLFKLVISLIMVVLGLTYENSLEMGASYYYGPIDLLFGRSVGNFGTTNIILLLFLGAVFWLDFYYKREIPFYVYATYFLCAFVYQFIDESFLLLNALLSSHVFVCAIFFAPLNKYSPALERTSHIYAIFIGVVMFFFSVVFSFVDGPYYAVAIGQVLFFMIEKIKFSKKAK